MTKCSRYSRIKISGGNLAANSVTSNKELIGVDNTTNMKENGGSGLQNSAHFLHAGWGTTGGYGSGMGQKESAIYKFADSSVKTGTERICRCSSEKNDYGCRSIYLWN